MWSIGAACIAVLASGEPACAQAGATVDSGDTAWILSATALVLFMTLPALALFYGGLVRAKNLLSVFMQRIAIACLVSVLWVLAGYSIAFGDGGSANAWWGGLGKAMLAGITRDSVQGTIPEALFVMYQMTFAIITPALIVGAYPERIRFPAVLWFSGLWVLLVYAPVTHWVWGGGWLFDRGVIDFAGGIVVHTTAGASALVLALVLGPRTGFPREIRPPHSPGYTYLGAAMLWVGWFGFNAGSAVAANGSAAMAMLVTHIAAATASLTWMIVEWSKFGKPSMIGLVTGTIAGLATITPAAGSVGPVGGILLGFAAGLVCYVAVQLIKSQFTIDDSLDVFAVHGVGGMLGSLAVPFLAVPALGGAGLAEGVSVGGQFGQQVLAVAVVAVWSAVLTFGLALAVKAVCGLRVGPDAEFDGLDVSSHGERAYDF